MSGRVLVTGGLGYLGGRLCTHLAQSADTALRLTARPGRAMVPAWAGGLDVRDVDFADPGNLDPLVNGVDAIVHLAALNAPDSGADPDLAESVTVGGTAALAEAVERQGIRRLIYASTAHVYGAPLVGDIDEETPPHPAHPYATTHLAAENIVLDAGGIVLRLSNVIGPPADADANCWMLVANDLCREAATKGTVSLRGPGTEQRDFVAMTDVLGAIVHMMGLPNLPDQRLFNLGSGEGLSVFNLARRISDRAEALFGRAVPVTRPEPGPDAPARDLAYATQRLRGAGFQPAGNLDAEIDATLSFCREAFGS